MPGREHWGGEVAVLMVHRKRVFVNGIQHAVCACKKVATSFNDATLNCVFDGPLKKKAEIENGGGNVFYSISTNTWMNQWKGINT